ncbi:unnamed protein product [Diabrotica balteata]|uniref:Uncharacterized protein n=1 Tax=Diabrotica balteata TaxID=107213 RepID=A0A9N9SU33_DIABA|nr:unnamed protein product [Diabrotica balteata]
MTNSSTSNISTDVAHSDSEDEIIVNVNNVDFRLFTKTHSGGSDSEREDIKLTKEMDANKELVRSMDTLIEKMKTKNKRLIDRIHKMHRKNMKQITKPEEKISGKDQTIQKANAKDIRINEYNSNITKASSSIK